MSTVVDTLWPGADGDRGMQSLEVNLHRLRKALGVEGAVFHRHGQIGLQRDLVWVDLWSIWAALRAGPSVRALERIEQLYRGPLCPMSDLTLVEDERKRVRSADPRAAPRTIEWPDLLFWRPPGGQDRVGGYRDERAVSRRYGRAR